MNIQHLYDAAMGGGSPLLCCFYIYRDAEITVTVVFVLNVAHLFLKTVQHKIHTFCAVTTNFVVQ